MGFLSAELALILFGIEVCSEGSGGAGQPCPLGFE